MLPATAQAAAPGHVWYVSATAAPGGDGSLQAPFDQLTQVQQASGPGDTIVVEPAPLTVPPLDGGIALKPGQRLVGGGPPVVQPGPPLVAGGPPVTSASSLSALPRITNSSGATNSGDAVDLANHTEVANLVIDGSYRGGIYGSDVTEVDIHGNDVSGQNTSGTTGFIVLPFTIATYTPFVGVGPFSVPNGWAAILIDEATALGGISITSNYVHDGSCGNGIDLRAMNTADVTAQVAKNFVTRLPLCSLQRTVQEISTQARGSSTLRANLDGNTEADNGGPGANADGLFVNPAESGTLIESIDHNVDVNQIGGASSNGFEFLLSNGSATGYVKVSHSVFRNDPGDMLEEFNRGIGSKTTLILDHVLVQNTTISGGNPSYAIPPGTAFVSDNTGECLGIQSVGAGDETVFRMRDSSFTGCDNNGIEVTNNQVTGVGNLHAVSLDIDHSKIAGSRYYNLWVNNLTPLNQLRVRVQDSDLATSGSGVAVAFDQQPTGATDTAAIDLGAGALDSLGHNCIFGGAIYDLEATRYNVAAEHDWWGSAAGPQAGKVVASPGYTIDDTSPLTHEPAACQVP